jgi:hypothetical protein
MINVEKLDQEEFDKVIKQIENMTCSICRVPEHSQHKFDLVYFKDGEIIAVTNKECEGMFDRAFRGTFCKED